MTLQKMVNISEMLRSTDKENAVLALTLIEQNLNSINHAVLMLLYKNSPLGTLWNEHAPSTYELLKNMAASTNGTMFTYDHIFRVIQDTRSSCEDIQFIMNEYAYYLTSRLNKTVKEIKISVIEHD